MTKKRKTLPKDFEELLNQGDLDRLKAVFDTCLVDARGSIWKHTTLAYSECPDDLARWLVEQGADLSAPDSYGSAPLYSRAGDRKGGLAILLELGADIHHGEHGRGTALHTAADAGHIENVRVLLEHGARATALDSSGATPLAYALQRCSNLQIPRMVTIADMLLKAGDQITPELQERVTEIGKTFEFHRARFNPEYLDETDAALGRLYALFDVTPVGSRTMHDGVSLIVATAPRWEDRHQELWELLIPSQGTAGTVQGEVIRISGRIANELDGNGGINWDADYKRMADALLMHLSSGTPLPRTDIDEAATLTAQVKRRGDGAQRLCELAVNWVALNPAPVTLESPDYNR
jgi:hypothetical protein